MTNKLGNRNLFAVKYLIAFLPIAWILLRIDFIELRNAISATEWWVIPVISLLTIILMFLQGFKWAVLLRAFIPDLSLSRVLSCHFKGIYYSLFLPTSAAQDVVRTVLLSRNNDYSIAWGATWLTRISGLFVLLMLSFIGLLLMEPAAIPKGMVPATVISWCIIILIIFMSFSKKLTRLFNRIIKKVMPERFILTMERIREGIYRYRTRKFCLVKVLFITLITHLLFILNAVLMFRGITGAFHIKECLLYIPLIEVICLSVPLTPNGVGIRDALSALMFNRIGLPDEQLGTYIIFGLITVILKVVGGIPILYEWLKKL